MQGVKLSLELEIAINLLEKLLEKDHKLAINAVQKFNEGQRLDNSTLEAISSILN